MNYRDHIIAIRKDPTVGRGSCSPIDECWEDEELITELKETGIDDSPSNIERAVRHFQYLHNLWKEREEDAKNA